VNVLGYLTAVLLLGIAAQWLAWRLRLPAILLLLVMGIVSGRFLDPEVLIGRDVLFPVISLSVAVVLFEGGLSLRLAELREAGGAVLRLVTIGILVTWIGATLAAHFIMGFYWSISALLGAVLVVSGPTTIIPLLRHIRPRPRLGSTAKWEGIFNDPIGAILAVLVYEGIVLGGSNEAGAIMFWGVAKAALVGIGLGAAATLFIWVLVKRYWVPDFLQNPVVLAVVIGSFTASNALQPESGLLTVTIFGVALVNLREIDIQHVIEFKENLRVLLISTLFIVLGARVSPEQMLATGLAGAAFVGVLIVLVRPAAVFLSTLGTELSRRERVMLGWLAPRGIVAAAVVSIFALEMHHESAGSDVSEALIAQAEQMVPAAFLVIVGTVAVYGLTAGLLARRLGVADPNPQGVLFAGASPMVRAIADMLQEEGFRVLLVDTNRPNIREARLAGLPAVHGSIVAERTREELDMSGIGRLLAMTPNSEINLLAIQQFEDELDGSGVYQLATDARDSSDRQGLSKVSHGRILFAKDATYGNLAKRRAAGYRVKKTPLTEEFDHERYRELYGDEALVLFTIDENRRLTVQSVDRTEKPRPGQTVIGLVKMPEASEKAQKSKGGNEAGVQEPKKDATTPSGS